MTKAFQRLADSVLKHLGQDAVLHSGTTQTPCRVNVERGVQMMGYMNDGVIARDIATLHTAIGAKVGDTVVLDGTGETLLLDALLANNGALTRFVVQN